MFSGANSTFSKDKDNYYNFNMGGKIEAYGKIQSLLNNSTTAPTGCFALLFAERSQLVKAPILNATTLTDWCYYRMFIRCTGLVTGPKIQATSYTGNYGANYMFYSCSKLTSIEVNFTSWGTFWDQWVSGVAASGTFTKPQALQETHGNSKIPNGWTVINK